MKHHERDCVVDCSLVFHELVWAFKAIFPFAMPFSQHLKNLLTLNKFFPTKLKKKEKM